MKATLEAIALHHGGKARWRSWRIWSCGKGAREAIGSMIAAHPEYFGVEIQELAVLGCGS